MDYNRVVKDLNGYSCTQFIEKIKEKFQVEEFKGKVIISQIENIPLVCT